MAVNVKQWYEQQAAALGISEADREAAERIFSNPALANVLSRDFVPVSDFHSQLDRQKQTLQGQIQQLNDYNSRWQEAYETDWAPRLSALDRLEAAGFDVNGVSADDRGGVVNNQNGRTYTAEEVQALLDQRLAQFQATSVEPIRVGMADYATFVADKASEYREEYGKRFDAAKFREFAATNAAQYGTLDAAYNAFTTEERAAKVEKDRKAWEEQRTAEIRMEMASQYQIPEFASGPAEGSPFHTLQDSAPSGQQPGAAAPQQPSRDANRQEFAKKFIGKDFNITI